MKNLILSSCFVAIPLFSGSQYVTIPDANFVTVLQTLYPACMVGDQMDTTCAPIITEAVLDCSYQSIADLDGVQYFDELVILICNNNNLSALPTLNDTLNMLECSNNFITTVGSLPSGLMTFIINNNPVTTFASLPFALQVFYANDCPSIVPPVFPSFLSECHLNNCNLSSVPALPAALSTLSIGGNPLISLAGLPSGLVQLFCQNLTLTDISGLPSSLMTLDAGFGAFSTVGALPAGLNVLKLNDNLLVSCPTLPATLTELHLANNGISTLPDLPIGLVYLNISGNSIFCAPELPDNLIDFTWMPNPFTCVPNYPDLTGDWFPALYSVPLCESGDLVGNPYGCASALGIFGKVFDDTGSDCSTVGDSGAYNVPISIYDSGGSFIGITGTDSEGKYFIDEDPGTYTLKIDTSSAFVVPCLYPGIDTTVTISAADSLIDGVDFTVECGPGFDVGVLGATFFPFLFPSLDAYLPVTAGDFSAWYGLACAGGVSGSVVVDITGPVTYIGPSPGTMVPSSVSGLTLTYTVSDFADIDFIGFIVPMFEVETSATLGDSVCVSVSVTPTTGDGDVSNNNFYSCFAVMTSFDPNNKLVYPSQVDPGYEDWLYYTINFQNTGTASAINVRLKDTLSMDLNWSTFQMTGYSHANNYHLTDGVLTVQYPNIWLPDSTSDEAGSHGYFQFRIKPNPGMTDGSTIDNEVGIYFDWNSPVITNTATVTFGVLGESEFANSGIRIYPNPVDGYFYLEGNGINGNEHIEVFDATGRKLNITMSNENTRIRVDLENRSEGLVVLVVNNENGIHQHKLVLR